MTGSIRLDRSKERKIKKLGLRQSMHEPDERRERRENRQTAFDERGAKGRIGTKGMVEPAEDEAATASSWLFNTFACD